MVEGPQGDLALCPSAYEEMSINQGRIGMMTSYVVPTFAVGEPNAFVVVVVGRMCLGLIVCGAGCAGAFFAHPKWLVGVVCMELCDGSYGDLSQHLQRLYFPSMLHALLKGGQANHDQDILMIDLSVSQPPCSSVTRYHHTTGLDEL